MLSCKKIAFGCYGIPHGVDYSQTNPPLDKLLGKRPKVRRGQRQSQLAAKRFWNNSNLNRTPTESSLALPIEPQDESAFGSVKPVLDLVLTADTCLVVTGKAPEQDLAEIIVAERKYPTRFAYRPDADTKLRQLALAGADVVLLPSSLGFRGTNVLAAMRYGTLPIVRIRGGVRQLVSDYDPVSDSGCRFRLRQPFTNGALGFDPTGEAGLSRAGRMEKTGPSSAGRRFFLDRVSEGFRQTVRQPFATSTALSGLRCRPMVSGHLMLPEIVTPIPGPRSRELALVAFEIRKSKRDLSRSGFPGFLGDELRERMSGMSTEIVFWILPAASRL